MTRSRAVVLVAVACLSSLALTACQEKKTGLPFVIANITPGTFVAHDQTRLDYQVQARGDELAAVAIDFSKDGGATSGHTTPAPGSPGLFTFGAPYGEAQFFIWDSVKDLGPGLHRKVSLVFAAITFSQKGTVLPTTPFIADETDRLVSLGSGISRGHVVAAPFPDGSVWIPAGVLPTGGAVDASGELYDPANNTLSSVVGLQSPRQDPGIALLADGRILVAGGRDSTGVPSNAAEAGRRAPDGSVSDTAVPGGLVKARADVAFAALADGRAIAVGGLSSQSVVLSDFELFDPSANGGTGAFTLGATNALAARRGATATRLGDGRVLIVGGVDGSGQPILTAALFDPATLSFAPAGIMVQPRVRHRAVRLPDGRVLIAGGATDFTTSAALAAAEVWDPANGVFSALPFMLHPRVDLGLDLAGGRVVAWGGSTDPTAGGEIFDLDKSAWLAVSFPDGATRPDATIVTTGPGRALVAGGDLPPSLYWPRASTGQEAWSDTPSFTAARVDHVAVRTAIGEVVVAGGASGIASAVATAEVFDPRDDSFRAATSMSVPRVGAAGALLPNGRILVAGGTDATGNVLGSAEVYDPAFNTWSPVGPLATPRTGATATASLGRVLVVGGLDATGKPIGAAEVFDVSDNGFSPAGTLTTPRSQHDTRVGALGRIVIAGGVDATGTPIADAEVWDPARVGFVGTVPLSSGRAGPVLVEGQGPFDVLVLGGISTGGAALSDIDVIDPSVPALRPRSLDGLAPRAFGGGGGLTHIDPLNPLDPPTSLAIFGFGIDGKGAFRDRALIATFPDAAFTPDTTVDTTTHLGLERTRIGRLRPRVVELIDGRLLATGGIDPRGVVVAGAETFAP
jgi:hypothetical protein